MAEPVADRTGGAAGAIGSIHTDNWSSPPTPASGDLWAPADLDNLLTLRYDGSNWVPAFDQLGLSYFFDQSYLTSSMEVVSALTSRLTLPTEDRSMLPGNATWSITNELGELTTNTSSADHMVEWDLPAPAERILYIVDGFHMGEGFAGGIYIAPATISGAQTTVQDVWYQTGNATVGGIWQESGGYSQLEEDELFKPHSQSENPVYSVALLYDNSTNDIMLFKRWGGGPWFRSCADTTATFGDMNVLGMLVTSSISNTGQYFRMMAPMAVFKVDA